MAPNIPESGPKINAQRAKHSPYRLVCPGSLPSASNHYPTGGLMHLDEHITGGIAVVSVKGDLLYEEDHSLLSRKVESLASDEITKIVLDCGNLNNINSEGLASLLSLAKRIRTIGGDIRIAGLDQHLENILA